MYVLPSCIYLNHATYVCNEVRKSIYTRSRLKNKVLEKSYDFKKSLYKMQKRLNIYHFEKNT